ncbi:MAG: DNA-directed RNA polymerase subunit beta [Candidatus Terrybacteria bacterium CG10_big_fil_rev_8_21_14_0_10_41_10]|uniref:DNA-directed RNA polymerase subunit beta n=1 Tax=Candidatus Terrybacteria bacterium CG10_big_fil_rev_8_21_14_0_10_41_10 TaxID=1975026 RepID=A0A2M8LAU1_9BACT|nr:MAG: DNA-directed RNA polymerase subunit beta [Candidatus Terrybacteria bacterium CG10_big_fil_rev_8_21_14_0_10_41_10]
MDTKTTSDKVTKKYFSKFKDSIASMPNLVRMQTDSYEWLMTEGIKELLEEFSPIQDYSKKKFILEFLGFTIDEPKQTEYSAKANNLTLEAPLRIKVKLTNKELGTTKEQEIFLSDFPFMTDHGTFVVNGIERVIVPQLARSFGVQFMLNQIKGKKYFASKIIPSRGIWIEIETDPDGAIYVRIDNKRKVPATCLLRIFGLDTDEKIEKAFADVEGGGLAYIKNTLEKDTAKTVEDSYVEIYRRLRPGEPADMLNYENSKSYIDSIFDKERYDLSLIGRYKINYRLGMPIDNIRKEPRALSLNDLVAVISNIIKMNNDPMAREDDIDNLGNRRVRGVGELFQQKLRTGMIRMKRNIQDRMSTVDPTSLVPSQLINNRPFMTAIKEFLTSNQLSQFMSQKNCLDELEHLRRLSALGPGGLNRERAGFEVRDVHPSHYGRICPIQTPEGPNVGLVVHLAIYAKINEFGIIETPYRKVVDGKVTNEVVYLSALDELKYNIAHAGVRYDKKTGELQDDMVEARVRTQAGVIAKDKIDFMDVALNQAYSVSTSMIPFLEHDDSTRVMMGSNMQKQAVSCIKPEAPFVATGMEEKAAYDTGRVVICEEDGEVESLDASKIVIKSKDKKKKTYDLATFLRSNAFTTIHQRPIVNMGQQIKKGEVIADNYSTDRGQMSLGQNALVAFLSWRGANFEDAIIISERMVKEDKFSSIHVEEYSVSVRDTKLGPEITTCDIPNVGEDKLKDLDEDGIVRIGAEVRAGDILVGKISPKGEVELTPEERLLRSIFGERARDVKDTSLRLDHGKQGRIVGIKIFSRDNGDKLEPGVIKQIFIEVANLRKISVGDKLAGRHGNKGVISKVLPAEDMPYLEDGTPVDIILNPLGVASRMNIGQILETHLGWAASKLGYQAITPAFAGATEEEIKEELKKAGIPEDGKVKMYDGRTGDAFDQKVTVGQIYMLKLDHMVEDKLHMRSIGPYSLITQQPLGGKAQSGGQRFGEMEVWALEGYGAAHTLQEMLTIKSDDILGRSSAYNSIIRGEKFKSPNLPASFHVLLSELRGLSLDIELKGLKNQQDLK